MSRHGPSEMREAWTMYRREKNVPRVLYVCEHPSIKVSKGQKGLDCPKPWCLSLSLPSNKQAQRERGWPRPARPGSLRCCQFGEPTKLASNFNNWHMAANATSYTTSLDNPTVIAVRKGCALTRNIAKCLSGSEQRAARGRHCTLDISQRDF